MILPFKRNFPWGEPTHFMEKILMSAGWKYEDKDWKPKIHTMRSNPRWIAGKTMHMAYGVRTKNYFQFNRDIPALEKVSGVQPIAIKYHSGLLLPTVAIDGRILTDQEVDTIAVNDGFEGINDFFNWFDKDYQGRIIHWTSFRY